MYTYSSFLGYQWLVCLQFNGFVLSNMSYLPNYHVKVEHFGQSIHRLFRYQSVVLCLSIMRSVISVYFRCLARRIQVFKDSQCLKTASHEKCRRTFRISIFVDITKNGQTIRSLKVKYFVLRIQRPLIKRRII